MSTLLAMTTAATAGIVVLVVILVLALVLFAMLNRRKHLRSRWDKIQVRFVDEPRQCVEQADSLVAETMKRLADSFSKQRENLEQQWRRGGDISTEDLRLALRRYRSFFGRLMQV